MKDIIIDNVSFKNNSGAKANLIYIESQEVKSLTIINSKIEGTE